MNQPLAPITTPYALPAIIMAAGDQAALRFLEFFAGTLRNPHTRRAYGRAVGTFLAWCEDRGVASIAAVQPLHVATWIEAQTHERSAPSVKQQLAAIKHLFDWLVTGQVMPFIRASLSGRLRPLGLLYLKIIVGRHRAHHPLG